MMYTYSFLKSVIKAKSVAFLSLITMTIDKNSKNRITQQRNKSVKEISAIEIFLHLVNPSYMLRVILKERSLKQVKLDFDYEKRNEKRIP